MMIASINGWELTQQNNGNIIISVDGVKAGEVSSEAEAKDFCLTNDPLSTEINYWEVCLNVSVERRISDCCGQCPYAAKLGSITSCQLGRDE